MIQEILTKIEEYKTIIIHRHERPDPDAIGSQAGLRQMIKDTYSEKDVFIVGEEEESLTFITNMDSIQDDTYTNALVIVCDTANEPRISDQRYKLGDYLIKIDHHPNEEPYGDLSWVDTTFSSVSEMVFELYEAGRKRGYTLTDSAALFLYAGIVGDTGRFRYPNTTDRTHRYASELVKRNIDHNAFYSKLYKKDIKVTRFEGFILQHFQVMDSGLAYIKITKDLLDRFGVTSSESSQLVNAFSEVEGIKAWVHFVEDEAGEIRVRLRSKGPRINDIAQKYRGGGHPLASGAKASSWEEVDTIISDLGERCNEYK